MEEGVNNFNSTTYVTTQPQKKSKKWVIAILISFLLIICLIGTYFLYDYSINAKNLRFDETVTYIGFKCMDYCDYALDSMEGSYCYEKCFDINFDNFREMGKTQGGGYTSEFKLKHGIYEDDDSYSCRSLTEPSDFKECNSKRLNKYESYFSKLDFIEIDKSRVGIEILNYTCLDSGIDVEIKVREEGGVDGFEGVVDIEGISYPTTKFSQKIDEGSVYNYRLSEKNINFEDENVRFAIAFIKGDKTSQNSEYFECN